MTGGSLQSLDVAAALLEETQSGREGADASSETSWSPTSSFALAPPALLACLAPIIPSLVHHVASKAREAAAYGLSHGGAPLAIRHAKVHATYTAPPHDPTSVYASPLPSREGAPRLGVFTLQAIRFLVAVGQCRFAALEEVVVQSRVWVAVLDAVTAFAWHSLLHSTVEAAVTDVLARGSTAMRHHLVVDCALIDRIVLACRVSELPRSLADLKRGVRGKRVGYVGHFMALANTLLAVATSLDEASKAALVGHAAWWDLVDHELAVRNYIAAEFIGGTAPTSNELDPAASGRPGGGQSAGAGAVDEIASSSLPGSRRIDG